MQEFWPTEHELLLFYIGFGIFVASNLYGYLTSKGTFRERIRSAFSWWSFFLPVGFPLIVYLLRILRL